MEAKRSRAFIYTINNYTSDDLKQFMTMKMRKQCKYYIFGFEVGQQGTPHIQGYIYFHNQKKFKEVSGFLPRAHIEIAHGSVEQNISYTSKDEKYIEWGEKPEIGKRTDLKNIKEKVMNNIPVKDIIPDIENLQQLKFMEGLLKYQPHKDIPKKVYWFYGKSGTGKTRSAIELAKGDYYITTNNIKFMDGYTGQKTLIVDELRPNEFNYADLLRLTDRYPYRVNIKGSSMWLQSERIIITSCFPPEIFSSVTGEEHKQLERRIYKKVEFK